MGEARIGQNQQRPDSAGQSSSLSQALRQPLTREQAVQQLGCMADARLSDLNSFMSTTRQRAMSDLLRFARANDLSPTDVQEAIDGARKRFGPANAGTDAHDLSCAANPRSNPRFLGVSPLNGGSQSMLDGIRPRLSRE